ncbi:MAG: ABC transporter permease [Acidobacteria bacterium]|nr:ABC transporter permease [Acidobacteriota bacterium]
MAATSDILIKPRRGWQPVDLAEVIRYRELFFFLAWRDVKIRYRQTFLGGLWALLQPLLAMLIFSFVFHRMVGVASGGPPYPLFVFAGLAPWTFFSNAVIQSSNSLLASERLVSKIYFPRVFIPVASAAALLPDLVVSLAVVLILLPYYHWHLTYHFVMLPFFVLGIFLAASGLGLTLSACNVMFRDVKYAVPFFVQMGLFVTPVVYPLHYIPLRYRGLIGLNPMAGMVLGFQNALLGIPSPLKAELISFLISIFLFVSGLFIFRRIERLFADII